MLNKLFCVSHLFPEHTFYISLQNNDNTYQYGNGNVIHHLLFSGSLDHEHYNVLTRTDSNTTDVSINDSNSKKCMPTKKGNQDITV